ncbi:DUF2062 domain-containing protein [Pararhodospirillum oryzae]|uniref:DUF2062 domain-containing protein n=1 Tax=Pararhodospirillum oryzae TaxID=478448 RepID=A0A512H6R6_9PROT|nr:DUF2062 domain-containing protein [Pararhodospirillum oryzae]GEO81134.1 hypothetical protein ROR02_12650 [Pararhodospirillum oryzae]
MQRIRETFLPSMGWRRASRYLGHRIARLPGTPRSIAVGFACGVAGAFSPLLGLHFLLAALMALILRGNLIASALGTLVGNPWTFPFLWLASFEVGTWITGNSLGAPPADFHHLFADLSTAVSTLDGAMLAKDVLPVLVPMVIGSVPLGLVAGLIAYFPARRLVAAAQASRRGRRRAPPLLPPLSDPMTP